MGKIIQLFKKAAPVTDWHILEQQLGPYKRQTWVPRTKNGRAYRSASKFSGIPSLAEGETWPRCLHCQQPMQLFLQLNSAHLPDEIGKPFGDGFLQVFYCTNEEQACETRCEAFFPFAKSTLVRVLDFTQEQSLCSISNPVKDAFPEKIITGWERKTDYPNREELEERGCSFSDGQYEMLSELGYPLSGDKLLGWPFWVQGVEYPDCPDCGKRMKPIFQIDSEDNVPYMFGDAGCAHITQCEEHREHMAIAWACY